MARIEQIIKEINGVETEIYPVAIHQSVVDESNNETLDVTLAKKATHGYESNPKTLKQVDDEVIQLAGDVNELGIKDAVQGAKIKDIENVISTMNLNQSAQLSVSGVSPLSLPKNAANGGMQVKLEGLTAENLVENGDFRNGTTGWIAGSNTTAVLETGSVLLSKIDNSGVIVYRSLSATYTIANATDVYYLAGKIKCNTLPSNNVEIGQSNGAGIMYGLMSATAVNTTEIQTVSARGSLNITSTFSYCGVAVNSSYIGTINMYGLILINLTQAFGAGNEPDLATCDIIFSDYFEGVKSFVPTGRVRSVDKNGLNPTTLYLTAPELRSNGAVKDEIRKGANGYELVKRVGDTDLAGATETLNFAGLDFSDNTKWVNTANTASSTVSGFATSAAGGMTSNLYNTKYVSKGFYSLFIIKGTSSVSWSLNGGGSSPIYASFGAGNFDAVIFGTPATYESIYIRLSGAGDITFTEFNVKILTLSSDLVLSGSFFTKLNDGTILYTLATPEIIPISYGGVLNSAENGTVYHEPVIADAGVYGSNLPILNTDYPIASIEEVIKHEEGVDIYLDVSTAVIASDGLSFTHPDLASGDLVLFTYAFDKESTNGNITATFYDSNVVKIDTVTGKAYKIVDVVTNGVLTRTLTEV